jgi:plastocyanin
MRPWATALLGIALHTPLVEAGTIAGTVTVIEKGERSMDDASGAVVFLEGAAAKGNPVRTAIKMKGKAFVPHQVVVPVGSTVDFPNEDTIFHNVFSVSGSNRFDLDLYRKPKKGSATFIHPGVVRVYCNIHPQMSALVMVVDSAYFATTKKNGAFSITGVPSGKYRLVAWHERGPEQAVEVAVPESGAVKADLALDASGYKGVRHKNKYGKDYQAQDKY